jgi:hypothetical protein
MSKGFSASRSVAVAVALLLAALATTLVSAQSPLRRQYREGETLTYRMNGQNEAWKYSLQADAVVKKDASGTFFEEIRWSPMMSDGQQLPVSEAAAAYRQRLSLDLNSMPSAPDLRNVDPKMVGPVSDLMTFYADLWLILKMGALHKPGDHFYFAMPMTPSWADGSRVLVGEDSIAFDMTFQSIDAASQTATLMVRHVPPAKPTVHLSADWMRAPVAGTPNNWVQVQKEQDGTFTAAVGKETFDVELKVSLADGRILHGTMENPVTTIERTCQDAALSKCSDPKPHLILRKIEITLAQ